LRPATEYEVLAAPQSNGGKARDNEAKARDGGAVPKEQEALMVRTTDYPKKAGMPTGNKAASPRRHAWLLCALLLVTLLAAPGFAQSIDPSSDTVDSAAPTADGPDPLYIPDVSHWLPQANSRESLTKTMQIFVVMTLLMVAPSIILMMTSFVRMVVVLALLKRAIGTQNLPPSQVIVGLALFMTFLVMAPTWSRIRERAVNPYLEGNMAQLDALGAANGELREFMFNQIEACENEEDVYMMYEYATQQSIPADEALRKDDVPTSALIPAFILSELKTAFVLGFRIYLPFLVIDMVIATVLVSMGMMMLPPVLISLPFKLLLFVLADGWHLVAGSLLASVN